MRRVRPLLVLILIIAVLGVVPASAEVRVVRPTDDLGDHVAVSVGFSQLTFEQSAEVLISRDDAFPDALAGGALQALPQPLLLTPSDALAPEVLAELQRLGATRATVLGGAAAIGPGVVAELEDAGLQVVRREGPARVETAASIAAAIGPVEEAVLARAYPRDEPTQAFADSLAAGAWAADTGAPVLLTASEELSAATAAHLRDSGITTVHVVGGVDAIAEPVLEEVRALGITVDRVAGGSRFDTAIAVADRRDLTAAAGTVILVDGTSPGGWAAGFAAAAHSGQVQAPIVLSAGPDLPPATRDWLRSIAAAPDGEARTLVCAAPAAACDQAADLLDSVLVTLSQEGTVVHHGSPVQGTAAADVVEVAVSGPCVPGGIQTVAPDDRGAFELVIAPSGEAPTADATCVLDWVATLSDGGAQQGAATVQLDVIAMALDDPDGQLALGQQVAVALDDQAITLLDIGGPCAGGAAEARPQRGRFTLPPIADDLALGLCQLRVGIDFADGGRQETILPVPVLCLGGYVAEHDIDDFALFDGEPDLFRLSFSPDDAFEVGGQPVDHDAFRTALDVGDCITPFRPQVDPPGTPHRLWDVDRCTEPLLPGYVAPRRVWAIDEDAGLYVTEVGGTSNTVAYVAGDDFWVDLDDAATLEEFEDVLEPGVCVDHEPARQGGTAVHRVTSAEVIPYGSYRGF